MRTGKTSPADILTGNRTAVTGENWTTYTRTSRQTDSQTDMYLALHTNIPGMETIPSNWDQQTATANAGTLKLCITNNNITKRFKNMQINTLFSRHKVWFLYNIRSRLGFHVS